MIEAYRLCLVGFGNVGKAFARVLLKKKTGLAEHYGTSFTTPVNPHTGQHARADFLFIIEVA